MNIQYTFSMIKPDATKRNIIGKIITYLESSGLEIVEQRMHTLSLDEAKKFYYEHKDRSFFSEMVEEMTSGKVVLQILKGENAIQKNREIMGITDPKNAEIGTIRRDLGLSIQENSIHGSDSVESATREITFFFPNFDVNKFV